jgi:hypothetical protein
VSPFVGQATLSDGVALEAVVPALSEGAASEFSLFGACPIDQRGVVGRGHVSEIASAQ